MLDNTTTATTTSSSTVFSTTSEDKSDDETIWSQYGVIIVSTTSVFIFLVIIFIISMAVFTKWRTKRRTVGAYNPSRAEKQDGQANKVVFSIPLPTPERLI